MSDLEDFEAFQQQNHSGQIFYEDLEREVLEQRKEIESLTSENTRLRALLEEMPWGSIERICSAFEGIEPASEDGMVYVVRRLLAIKEKIE